jgi:hypothetical protein
MGKKNLNKALLNGFFDHPDGELFERVIIFIFKILANIIA